MSDEPSNGLIKRAGLSLSAISPPLTGPLVHSLSRPKVVSAGEVLVFSPSASSCLWRFPSLHRTKVSRITAGSGGAPFAEAASLRYLSSSSLIGSRAVEDWINKKGEG